MSYSRVHFVAEKRIHKKFHTADGLLQRVSHFEEEINIFVSQTEKDIVNRRRAIG
jgi:hypothetical protein